MEIKFEKKNTEFIVQITIIIVLALLLVYYVGKTSGGESSSGGGIATVSASEIISTGIPEIYGSVLKISYDDVSASNRAAADKTIGIMAAIDRGETLEGDNLDRYIRIVSDISCEFCCGANSIIFSDGRAACGCAHSYAMRGLAKYLIKYHPEQFTDDEILEELGKWKVLFFPGKHEAKAAVLKSKGIELNYINLASNKYRGIEKGAGSGGMVGGC